MFNRWMKRLVPTQWKNELREYLTTHAFRLPEPQIEAIAKRFKTKPELVELLNDEIAVRLSNAILDFVEEKL